MSRILSSYESSGGGVFVLRRAIAAGSSFLVARLRVAHVGSLVLKRLTDLTRTIVDRGTDSAGQAPARAPTGLLADDTDVSDRPRPRQGCPQATRSAVGVRRAGTSPGMRTLAYSGRT